MDFVSCACAATGYLPGAGQLHECPTISVFIVFDFAMQLKLCFSVTLIAKSSASFSTPSTYICCLLFFVCSCSSSSRKASFLLIGHRWIPFCPDSSTQNISDKPLQLEDQLIAGYVNIENPSGMVSLRDHKWLFATIDSSYVSVFCFNLFICTEASLHWRLPICRYVNPLCCTDYWATMNYHTNLLFCDVGNLLTLIWMIWYI